MMEKNDAFYNHNHCDKQQWVDDNATAFLVDTDDDMTWDSSDDDHDDDATWTTERDDTRVLGDRKDDDDATVVDVAMDY